MSIISLDQSRFQNYTIVANPKREFEFTSSSTSNLGSVPVFVDASKVLKDLDPTFAEDGYDSSGILKVHSEAVEDAVSSNSAGGDKNVFNTVSAYMNAVRAQPQGERQLKFQEIRRYEPGVKLDKNFLSKSVIKNNLFPYYSKFDPDLNWSYTNYNCLNFISGSKVPNNSAIIYRTSSPDVVDENVYPVESQIYIGPDFASIYFSNSTNQKFYVVFLNYTNFDINYDDSSKTFTIYLDPNNPVSGEQFKDLFDSITLDNELNISIFDISSTISMPVGSDLYFELKPGKISNYYAPHKSFTFDFWVKPKNPRLNIQDQVRAGTILHMSSCFAISLITGSSRGPDGFADRYKILLQLSQSAEISPSNFYFDSNENLSTSSPNGNYYWSSADSLLEGDWNHVNITWGGKDNNNGYGFIRVNGNVDTEFQILDEEIMQIFVDDAVSSDPDALILGNFFEGPNTDIDSQQAFFNFKVSQEQGLTAAGFDQDPDDFQFRHPLNAELHDVKIYNKAVLDHQVSDLASKGRSSLEEGLLFYLPVLFTKFSRDRRILQTPFQWFEGSSEDPFSVPLSFGVGGYELNLENFVREFVQGEYPRLYNMVTPQRETSVADPDLTSNDIIYGLHETASIDLTLDNKIARCRLHSILPCDNGNHRPSYELLIDDLSPLSSLQPGAFDKSKIYLDNLVPLDSSLASIQTPDSLEGENDNLLSQLSNVSPESPGDPSIAPGSVLTVLRRTMDPSSNEIAIFDVSNLFYGDRILPNSFVLTDEDPYLMEQNDKLILRDDGLGRIYRANSKGKLATWNCVGNILYGEGLIVIKSPHVRFIGKKHFKVELRGERNIHVLEVSVPVDFNQFGISNNPTYKPMLPTNSKNELASKFTYVTGLNLHDDNLNIIGRANFAQPIVKRDEDKFVIKLRMDF